MTRLEASANGSTDLLPDGRIVVGVGDMAVSADPATELITYALGSCIGVTVYDPVAKVGGLLHFMLPLAGESPNRAARPSMYGDTGIPLLFKSVYALGAVKERLIVSAAGGAEILDDEGCFRVGSRNRTLLRKIFWQNSVLISAEDTGGHSSRTMLMSLADGKVQIRSQGVGRVIWPQ
jgi:chemotaxis protein CheD